MSTRPNARRCWLADDANDSRRGEKEEERQSDREQEQLVALLVAAHITDTQILYVRF